MADIVVLTHLVRRDLWAPVLQVLEVEHRVTFLDIPGFGDAVLPADLPPTVDAMAQGVCAELRELDLADAHVVGISLGGAVAIEIARLRGARSVTAIGPAGFWAGVGAWGALTQIVIGIVITKLARPLVSLVASIAPTRRLLWWRVAAHPGRVPEEAARHMLLGSARHTRHLLDHPRTMASFVRAVAGYRVRPLNGSVPVTVVFGDKDRLTTFRTQAARSRTVLPGARHVTLEDCGHLPMYDGPDLVAQVILESVDGG